MYVKLSGTPAPFLRFLQANYLRQLNQKGDPEAVIRQFEAGRINSTEATLGEYVKALVKVDRLDSTALAQTLQVQLFSHIRYASKLVSFACVGCCCIGYLSKVAFTPFIVQRGARAQQAGASTSYASPNAFGSFASQAGQDASASQGSGLYRMFGGEHSPTTLHSGHDCLVLHCLARLHYTALSHSVS